MTIEARYMNVKSYRNDLVLKLHVLPSFDVCHTPHKPDDKIQDLQRFEPLLELLGGTNVG